MLIADELTQLRSYQLINVAGQDLDILTIKASLALHYQQELKGGLSDTKLGPFRT